jgi:hypothetical protein
VRAASYEIGQYRRETGRQRKEDRERKTETGRQRQEDRDRKTATGRQRKEDRERKTKGKKENAGQIACRRIEYTHCSLHLDPAHLAALATH